MKIAQYYRRLWRERNMERLTERAEIDKCPGIWVKEKIQEVRFKHD